MPTDFWEQGSGMAYIRRKNCDCMLTVGSDLLKRLEDARPLEALQSLCENKTEELLGGRVGTNYFIAFNDCGNADS